MSPVHVSTIIAIIGIVTVAIVTIIVLPLPSTLTTLIPQCQKTFDSLEGYDWPAAHSVCHNNPSNPQPDSK